MDVVDGAELTPLPFGAVHARRRRGLLDAVWIEADGIDQAVHQIRNRQAQNFLLVAHRDRVIDHEQQVELVRYHAPALAGSAGRTIGATASSTTSRARAARSAHVDGLDGSLIEGAC